MNAGELGLRAHAARILLALLIAALVWAAFPSAPATLGVLGLNALMVALFGDAGKHARSAVGVPTLPLGAAVEVDGIVEIEPAL